MYACLKQRKVHELFPETEHSMKGTSSHLITIHDLPLSNDTTHRVDYASKEPDPEAHKGVHIITFVWVFGYFALHNRRLLSREYLEA